MTKRGKHLLATQQLERARELRWYLIGRGVVEKLPPALLIDAIADWLKREYRLGIRAGKKEAR